MGHGSGVGDRHGEVPRGTDGWCREKLWAWGQARTQERLLEKSWESGLVPKFCHRCAVRP